MSVQPYLLPCPPSLWADPEPVPGLAADMPARAMHR